MPPSHFLASIDTAAVQPDQLTQTSGTKAKKENKGTKVEKDEDQDKEDDSSSADQVQASTSQPWKSCLLFVFRKKRLLIINFSVLNQNSCFCFYLFHEPIDLVSL